jgi:hypothetical protein
MVKLDMALNYLEKSREIKKNKEIGYLIPYIYILIGKKIIQKAGKIKLSEALLSHKTIEEKDKREFKHQATTNPIKFYESCKVCYQCYQIYTFIMKKHSIFSKKLNPIKKKPLKLIKNATTSELGILNKDNLNDLLADMSFYLTSCDMSCDNRVKDMYSQMTEFNMSKYDLQNKEILLRRKSRGYRDHNESSLDYIPNVKPQFPSRKNKKVLSIVAQFYIGKPRKIERRLIIK